jgi:TonB-linked SusC/RagA family outer membrane protein
MNKNKTMKDIEKDSTAKLRRLMKIGAAQGMIALMVCGVSMAHSNYAQLLDKEVTLSLHGISFERALKEIETVAGIKFVYSTDQLRVEGEVTLEASGKALRDVLHDLLAPRGILYKVHEKEASITLRKQVDGNRKDQSLLDEDTRGSKSIAVVQITGTVTEATTHQPMAGVNIVVKGTTNGTTTDAEGKYDIHADNGNILVFSFIGYTSMELQVGVQTVMDVVLQMDVKSLDEVVVNAGYYTTTKETQTGNIVKIEAKDIEKQPISNPVAALQGRVAGLEITQQTGVPGGNFQVRIRGTNSISNGNDPLYIIDGVPFTSSSMSFRETSGGILGNPSSVAGQGSSPLNSINPADIESIEVLKDADATAIYGSRGSNGVILITTKKGKAGKTKVDFNFYTGAGKVTRKMNLLKRQQYLEMRKEAFANDMVTPTAANARDLLVWDTTRYTDWQKVLIGGAAQTTDAQLSVSGGENSMQFSVGGGYHRETTVFPGNNADQRISVHSSIMNSSPNQKLKTSFSINYSGSSTNLLKQDLTSQALMLTPVAPEFYDDKGNLSWKNWTSTYENPLAYTKRVYEARTNNLIANAVISYAIFPNLEVKSSIGYTNTGMKAITATPISSQVPDPGAQNSTSFSNSSFQNWIIEPQLNWRPALGKGHFNVLAGATFLDQTTEGLAQTGYGFSSEALMKNISSARTVIVGTNYYSQYRYQAAFGRMNYSLKGRYIVNLTGRRDGSSRFGPGKQFANFGAVGLAWIFSKEGFIHNALPFLSFGKLRASYGIAGNDQLGDYQYLDTYSSSSGTYQGIIGLQPDRLSNPDFAWETNRKFESGIELEFLNSRILGSVSYYRNQSSNQLVGFPLPATTGFSTIQGNFPATVQNTGVEIVFNTRNIETTDFTWSTSFNMSVPHNKLVEFPNLAAFPAYANLYVMGEPMSIRKLYRNTGIDPVGGYYTFNDVNGDGKYGLEDRQTVRFVGRDFYGGLSNNFRYKGFRFDVFFQFIKQTGNNYVLNFDTPGLMANVPAFVMGRWGGAADNSSIQRFSQTGAPLTAYSRLASSEQSVSDASFIRLKNISLSYSLPQSWIKKMHMEAIRIFIHGQNLQTISKYKGLDPELPGSSQLPPLRVLTGGVHLTF